MGRLVNDAASQQGIQPDLPGEILKGQPVTTDNQIRIGRPEDFGLDSAEIDRKMKEARRNDDFFVAHSAELFEQHPDQWILIHSGGVVETFDEFLQLHNRRRELDPAVAAGSMHYIRRPGVWLL